MKCPGPEIFILVPAVEPIPVLAAAFTQDLGEELTLAPEVECTLGLAEDCTPAREVVFTLVPVVAST